MYQWGFRYGFFIIELNNIVLAYFIAGYITKARLSSVSKPRLINSISTVNPPILYITNRTKQYRWSNS